jgi:hypothetical protein
VLLSPPGVSVGNNDVAVAVMGTVLVSVANGTNATAVCNGVGVTVGRRLPTLASEVEVRGVLKSRVPVSTTCVAVGSSVGILVDTSVAVAVSSSASATLVVAEKVTTNVAVGERKPGKTRTL